MQYETEDEKSPGAGSSSMAAGAASPVKPFSSWKGLPGGLAQALGLFYVAFFLAGSARRYSPLLAWILFIAGTGLALYILTWSLLRALPAGRESGLARRMAGINELITRERVHRKAAAVAGIFLFSLHIRYCLVGRVRVNGPSMIPTLYSGQTLWTEKWSNGFDLPPLGFPFEDAWRSRFPTGKIPRFGLARLQRGDIVVFHYPGISKKNQWFVKRVIGLPGDRYEIQAGRLLINGQPFPEPYLPGGIATEPRPRLPQPPIQAAPAVLDLLDPRVRYSAMNGAPEKGLVPAHTVYLLGDNRAYSRDSRSFGFVPIFLIRGRAL